MGWRHLIFNRMGRSKYMLLERDRKECVNSHLIPSHWIFKIHAKTVKRRTSGKKNPMRTPPQKTRSLFWHFFVSNLNNLSRWSPSSGLVSTWPSGKKDLSAMIVFSHSPKRERLFHSSENRYMRSQQLEQVFSSLFFFLHIKNLRLCSPSTNS